MTTVFNVHGWMGLTGCSEPQALAAASRWLQDRQPQAAHFARHWGVEGDNAEFHISDFLESPTWEELQEDHAEDYFFRHDEEGELVEEGWVSSILEE